MVLGAPGRIVRQLDDSDLHDQKRRALGYEAKWRRFTNDIAANRRHAAVELSRGQGSVAAECWS